MDNLTGNEGQQGTVDPNVAQGAAQGAEGDSFAQGVQNSGQAGSWQDSLPESVRDWDEVKNSDSAEKFFDQVGNMRSLMGRSIRIPTADAGDEALAAFKEKLMDVDGVMMSPDGTESWADFFTGMGDEQKQQAYDLFKGNDDLSAEDRQKIDEDLASEVKAGVDRLKEEWGNSFDRNMAGAKSVVKLLDQKMGDGRLIAALDSTGAASSPDMIAAFAEIATMLGEKPVVDGVSVNQFAVSPAEAKDRIIEIEANPAYWGSDTPERKALIEKRSKYYDIAFTGDPQE